MQHNSNTWVGCGADLVKASLPTETFWLEPRILPMGGKMIIAGPSKLGKSFFSLSLARAFTLGEEPFGKDSGLWVLRPARVLLVDCELGPHRLQDNLINVYKHRESGLNNFFAVSKVLKVKLDTIEGRTLLKHYIMSFKPEILMLDPIGKLHNLDENSNQAVNALFDVIDELLALGSPWAMSAILAHHTRKTSSDPKYAVDEMDYNCMRGAAKWRDDPDAIVMLGNKARLNTSPHSSWRINASWTLRHGPEVEEMILSVNQQNDRRVRFIANASGAVPAGKTKVTTPPGGGLPVLTGH